MKKTLIFSLLVLAGAGFFLASPDKAAAAELSATDARSLGLALDAAGLVLDQVELKLDERASLNTAAVSGQLTGMTATLTHIDGVLKGSSSVVAAAPSPSSAVAGARTGPSRTQIAATPSENKTSEVAETPSLAADEEAAPEPSRGLVASVGDTIASKKFWIPALIVVAALAVGLTLFFRQRAPKPRTAPAKATS